MSDPNTKILVHLKKLGDQLWKYRLAHIHVSELPPAKKSRDNLSRAIGILADLKARHKDGEIFMMKNLDIVFVTRDVPHEALAAAGQAVQHVFLGDLPPTFTNIHGGENEFFTIFELETDLEKVSRWAEGAAGVATTTAESGQPQKTAVEMAQLSRIKEDILRTNITPMLFNQPVYLIGEGGKPQLMFNETYISIPMLEDTFCPGQSITVNKWLFNDLTEDLDSVVLKTLADPEERGSRRRVSINVNLSSVASESFVKFDAELPSDRRQGVILEINKTDIFENMRLYTELVPFLRKRGYRILLDGLSFLNIAAIDFNGIDCDFAKLFWSAEVQTLAPERMAATLMKLRPGGNPHFVLARCDSAESLRFAKQARINLLQGRLVDHMVKKNIPF